VSLVLLTRAASKVNAVLLAAGDVDVVDGEGDDDGDAGGAEEDAEESEVLPEDVNADGFDEDPEEAATSEVLDRDDRMPTLTPNGAVADALALVWDINVVLTLSAIESVEASIDAVEVFELDDVLISGAELVLETESDVARDSVAGEGAEVVVAIIVDCVVEPGTMDDPRLEDEYSVAVDVEFTYSVVVEYSVIVVQVVGDCATARLMHALVASNNMFFMIDICCEAVWDSSGSRFYHSALERNRKRGTAMILCIAHILGGWKMQA
jgi:hypothetical protein